MSKLYKESLQFAQDSVLTAPSRNDNQKEVIIHVVNQKGLRRHVVTLTFIFERVKDEWEFKKCNQT